MPKRCFSLVCSLILVGAFAACPEGDENCEVADEVSGDALLAININRTVKKHTKWLIRSCQELGSAAWGKSGDDDNVFGCAGSHAMKSLWDHNDAKAGNFPGTDGSVPGSKEDCWLSAGKDSDCGSRVLYHNDGISCKCHKEGLYCNPKHEPSFTVAECECGFHPAKQCRYGSNQNKNNAPHLDVDATPEDCYDQCHQQQDQAGGGYGCCQFRMDRNGGVGRCKFYRDINFDLGLDSPWGTPSVVDVSNEDKYAFSMEECPNV